LRDENKVIVGISFVENQKADSPTMDFPKKWNSTLDATHIYRVKVGSINLHDFHGELIQL